MSRRRKKIQAAKTAQRKELRPLRFAGSPDNGLAPGAGVPTPEEIREMFGPAKTLGAPIDKAEGLTLSMDSALENSGFYSLVQHAFSMGQPPQGNGFIGYPALSCLKQNGLVSACVETVADDMLREWIEIEGGEDGGGDAASEEVTRIEESVDAFSLRKVFLEATVTARYFGGCLIYIDTGASDPETLRRPLNLSEKSGEIGIGKLKGFKVIEPINVFPGNYDSANPLAKDYFEPQSWWVLGREIHASRFIKISTGDVPVLLRPSYNFFGIPTAQIIWDYVLHFQNDRTSNSRLLGKFSDTVLKTGMSEILTQAAGTANLDARLRYMVESRSNDGIFAIDKEAEDLVKIDTSISGVTDITRQDLEIICAINRTPAVKILGISPAGFNATGDGDLRNYYDHVSSQQEKILADGLRVSLECIQLHLFGRVDKSITYHFRELGGEDRQIESTIRKTNTDTLAALVVSEIITPEGARATIEANPDEYLVGLGDGIRAEREAMEASAGLEDFDNEKEESGRGFTIQAAEQPEGAAA